jgi:hypothetical protein
MNRNVMPRRSYAHSTIAHPEAEGVGRAVSAGIGEKKSASRMGEAGRR